MNFLKNMFGGNDEGAGGQDGGEGTFVCESCGQTRKKSERKQHEAEHEGGDSGKNVCEYC